MKLCVAPLLNLPLAEQVQLVLPNCLSSEIILALSICSTDSDNSETERITLDQHTVAVDLTVLVHHH